MPGQTVTEIRELLSAAGLSPLHRFGQNFLIDLNLMRKLVDAAAVGPSDVVLEVGPGTGSLTEIMLERGARVIAVEIDHGLQRILHSRLDAQPRFTLIEGDALAGKHALEPRITAELKRQVPGDGGSRKLVANLPYQIATPLVMELLHHTPLLSCIACTIQKEVAERLRSGPGTSDYGPLSIITQTLAQVEWIAKLPPTVFWPSPTVESAMVRITPMERSSLPVADPQRFASFVQSGFAQRRKMLRRLIKEMNISDADSRFAAAGISPEARPESLSVTQWQSFYQAMVR